LKKKDNNTSLVDIINQIAEQSNLPTVDRNPPKQNKNGQSGSGTKSSNQRQQFPNQAASNNS